MIKLSNFRKLSLENIVFIATFLSSVLLFIVIANEILSNQRLWFDALIMEYIRPIINTPTPYLDLLMVAITDTGGFTAVTMLTIIFSLLIIMIGQKINALILTINVISIVLANVILKLFFARMRPDLWPDLVAASGYSFPSGHAMASSALAFTLVALYWRSKYRNAFILIGFIYMFSVGISRVYLGVHYPSDVVAGWAFSGAWTLFFFSLIKLVRHYLKV